MSLTVNSERIIRIPEWKTDAENISRKSSKKWGTMCSYNLYPHNAAPIKHNGWQETKVDFYWSTAQTVSNPGMKLTSTDKHP